MATRPGSSHRAKDDDYDVDRAIGRSAEGQGCAINRNAGRTRELLLVDVIATCHLKRCSKEI